MANRVFIVPRRNDLAGMNLSLTDVHPNAGQKNSIYDGVPQNIYVPESIDVAGATVVNGIAYISGSLNTTLAAANNNVDDDTTGGGNDVTATQETAFGLAAYLFDRVQGGGTALATAPPLPFADANTVAGLILADVLTGTNLDLARINAHLNATVANTDLNGASGNSRSFGSVEDIMRILSGEVYRLPLLTILGEHSGGTKEFYALATRQALVQAQTPAQVASQGQFYASGSFLAASDAGYRARPTLIRNGSINASLAEGVIEGYSAAAGITVTNPSFAYNAADVTAWRPRAQRVTGANVPATGLDPAIHLYTDTGVCLT